VYDGKAILSVYARVSKRSHTGGKCVTYCGLTDSLLKSELKQLTIGANEEAWRSILKNCAKNMKKCEFLYLH
jgi:hypothetical protein